MFTAPRLVVIAAISGLLGVAVLANVGDVDQEPLAPGAEMTVAPGDVTPVSGLLIIEDLPDPGTITEHDWGTMHTGERWLMNYRMDDPLSVSMR
jgi:hypothetical protein